MILKRSSFMMLGSMVFSAALLLSACGDSSSTTNGDDDLGVTEVKAKSSSSSKKKNSSSSSDTSVKDAEDPSDLKESKSLPAPSGVTLTKLAPSVWELTFSYESDEAEKFVVQRFAPGNKSWEEYDEIDAEMTRFLVDGADNGGYYYRFAAKNDKTRSAYTKEVFVSDEAEYADGISLAAPTAKPNVSEENVLEIVLTGNYPSKKILNSTYNKNSKGKTVGGVYYQARFVTGAEKSVDTVKVSADKSSISKEFKNVDEQCNAYAQIRVVWTDKNGVSDYGDWSDPMGSKAGTNANLIDEDGRCNGKGSSDDEDSGSSSEKPGVSFAVPTNLMVQKQDAGTWMLEWSYVPVKTRPEDGFVVQKLDLEKSKWENFDTTGAGVYRAMITGLTDPYNYFRVAAFDDDGKSDFSSDVLIALTEEDAEAITVAPPANVTIARIAPSVWELSWQYDISTDNPDRKFIIQSSKLKDFEWTDVETDIEGNVRYYRIQGRDKIETYYRMAVIDKEDTSAFTEAVQLTPEIPYREYMALDVPVPSMKMVKWYTTAYEVDQDTSTKTDISYVDATAAYTITGNFISKYIAESEYTDTVYYEARWFTSLQHYNDFKNEGCEGKKNSDACDSCYWTEAFPYAEPSITKGFYESDSIIATILDNGQEKDSTMSIHNYCVYKSGYVSSDHSKIYDPSTDESTRIRLMNREEIMSSCLLSYLRGLCDYFVQLRIVWTDKNGETDWSEWTQPFSISDIGGADDICSK